MKNIKKDEINQTVAFETSDPAFFRDLLKAANAVVEEAEFVFDPEGIKLRSMDPSHISMVDLYIPCEFFDLYEVNKERRVCLNIKDVVKLVYGNKRGKLKDSSLWIGIDENRISIKGSGNLKSSKTYNLIEPYLEEEEIPEPRINFNSRISMVTRTLKRIIDDCNIHEYMLITVDPSRVLFQNADGSGTLIENELTSFADDILELNADGEQCAAYSVEYIKDLVKVIKPLSEVVTLEISTKQPMKITADLPMDARLIYYLAANTDNEHIKELIEGPQKEEPTAEEIEEPVEVPVIEVDIDVQHNDIDIDLIEVPKSESTFEVSETYRQYTQLLAAAMAEMTAHTKAEETNE
jgi:proliferating cell nuclear antigen